MAADHITAANTPPGTGQVPDRVGCWLTASLPNRFGLPIGRVSSSGSAAAEFVKPARGVKLVTSGMDYPYRCCAIGCADVATAMTKPAAAIILLIVLHPFVSVDGTRELVSEAPIERTGAC
jgi:hypothetical protein